MAKQTETRFGFGGDLIPADATNTAQWWFLTAILNVVPEAVKDLAALAADPSVSLEPDLDHRFRAWVDKWGFTDPWLLRVAEHTAVTWREKPELRGRIWMHSHAYWMPDFPQLAAPNWNPVEERETAYRARIDDYIETVKQTPDMVPVPTKHNLQHFEWLALTHVASMTATAVAAQCDGDGVGLEASVVRRRVAETAALCNITLRRQPRGRPKKKGHSPRTPRSHFFCLVALPWESPGKRQQPYSPRLSDFHV